MPTDEEYAYAVTKQLIELGASCQKAQSFIVAEPGIPIRSVYDVMAERLLISMREHFCPPREPTEFMVDAIHSVHRPGWAVEWSKVWTTMYDAWNCERQKEDST